MSFNDNEDFGYDPDDPFDFAFFGSEDSILELDGEEHDVILPESAGSFAIISSTTYLAKSRLKAYASFGFAGCTLFFALLTPFLTIGRSFLPYLLVLAGSATLYLLTRAMLYLKVTHNWEKVLAATQDQDPVVEYLAFRALGDTFAGEDGHKVVPTLGYIKWSAGLSARAEDVVQRRVDAIGVAIDAYSAAATKARNLGDEAACREVLYVVLNLISALQLPRFSKAVHIDNLDSLELAIVLYLIASDPQRKKFENKNKPLKNGKHNGTEGSSDVKKITKDDTSSDMDSDMDNNTDNNIDNDVVLYDFEQEISLDDLDFEQSFLPAPEPFLKKKKKSSQYDNQDIHGKADLVTLFERAGTILCRKESFVMAFHCHVNAGDHAASDSNTKKATQSYINAGFVACLSGEFNQVETMLHKSQTGLADSGVEEAQRWWVLSAMVADHWGDIGRCEEATLNASLLDSQRHP